MFYGGGKIMEYGNNMIGGDINEDYYSLFLFPFGIELIIINTDIEVHLTLWPIQLTFGIGKNITLFR